jgi:hypothetical protein
MPMSHPASEKYYKIFEKEEKNFQFFSSFSKILLTRVNDALLFRLLNK